MGASLGAGDKKSFNVELNIVPFIDLMSCLTAFLLATAVWVNIAQINIQPKGKSRDQQRIQEEDPPVKLSVLIQKEKIWVGVSRVGDFQEILKDSPTGPHNWDKFETTIKDHKASSFFADRQDIEIAAESTSVSPVTYQDVIRAMDLSIKVGFKDVGLSDPAGLSARPVQ